MQLKVRVHGDRKNEYDGKKGHVKQSIITVVDTDPSEYRFIPTFDYVLTDNEKDLYAGKLQDKVITLGVIDMKMWNGRLRADGAIIETPLDAKQK
jgi:Asp-tRNA(Asn)/Glu-tRNA(Gln) amidotransferase B subunit